MLICIHNAYFLLPIAATPDGTWRDVDVRVTAFVPAAATLLGAASAAPTQAWTVTPEAFAEPSHVEEFAMAVSGNGAKPRRYARLRVITFKSHN